MSVTYRIEQAPACRVINLSEIEKDIYAGAGWKLARFESDTLVELFYPIDEVVYQDDIQALADEALTAATSWLEQAQGEVWLVMCSGYQLCDPIKIDPSNAAALAKLARVIGEELAEI